MWKLAAFLLIAAVCVNAEDEVPQPNGKFTICFTPTSLITGFMENEFTKPKEKKCKKKFK